MAKAKRSRTVKAAVATSKDCPVLIENWKSLTAQITKLNGDLAALLVKRNTLENEMRAKGCQIPK